MHASPSSINVREVLETDPIDPEIGHINVLWALVIGGVVSLLLSFYSLPPAIAWGMFYTNVIFWMGLSAGGVAFVAILQIVKAKWSAPVRRIAEAHVSYFFFGYLLFLCSYFGRRYLFPWSLHNEEHGRGLWMDIDFVYLRYAILLGILFVVMLRFVRLSLRGDVGLVRERSEPKSKWFNFSYNMLVKNWRGSAEEIPDIHRKLSLYAPIVVLLYSFVYSLFVFDMVMSMDGAWYSNLIGAFVSVGNIYLAILGTTFLVVYFSKKSPAYERTLTAQQFWDLGKLSFGFCMIWAYLVFAQFLVTWYGNLPEETQWMILRTREYPWKGLAWTCFALCFVIPFILLLSRDLKKTRRALALCVSIPFAGIWLEKYMLIMPQLSPARVPLTAIDLILSLGFLGLYGLCVLSFMRRYPYIAVSSIAVAAGQRQ